MASTVPVSEDFTVPKYTSTATPKWNGTQTEVSKDLVVREAIEECGYEYLETERAFCIMEYLTYVSGCFRVC